MSLILIHFEQGNFPSHFLPCFKRGKHSAILESQYKKMQHLGFDKSIPYCLLSRDSSSIGSPHYILSAGYNGESI